MAYLVTWIVSWIVIGFVLYKLTLESKNRGATSPAFVGVGGGFIGSLVFMIVVAMIWPVNGENEQAGNQANVSQEDACKADWHKCADNAMLVNHSDIYYNAVVACKDEADHEAKYGHPDFPFAAFGTFYKGDGYLKSGVILLEEQDASFQNGFGAMARATVTCAYDMQKREVVDMTIVPH